jgi:hypothetical protein
MPKFLDYLKPIGLGNAMLPGLDKKVGEFFFGTPERQEQRSLLGPDQEPLKRQLFEAIQGPGAG